MRGHRGILIWLSDRVRPSTSDRGAALISAMLFIVLLSSLSLLMLGVLLGQQGPALLTAKYAQTGYAAQAGLQSTLNTLRTIDHTTAQGVFGNRALLPCTLSGSVDGSSDDLTYDVTIQYFATDPTYQSDTWREAHHMACTGAGVSIQPAYAVIMSRGLGEDLVGQESGDGDRGIAAVYAFKLSNINIPGGLLLSSATGYCVRATSATAGAQLRWVANANCTVAETDNWIYTENIEFQLASSQTATYPNGLCITMGAQSGTDYALTLQPCLPIPDAARWNQLWSIDGGTTLWGQKNPISAGRSSICLGHRNLFAGGTVVATTTSCQGWAPDFKVGSGAASHSTNQVVSFAEFGRCMDVTNGTISFSHMIVWPCKQDPTGTGNGLNWNHKFYYTEAEDLQGSVSTTITSRVNNNANQTYCLQTPLNTSASVYPIFVACNGSARQQWTRVADSLNGYGTSWIFVDTYDRCITPLQQDKFAGWISKIGVAACAGTAVQKWNAPPYSTEAVVGGFKEISG